MTWFKVDDKLHDHRKARGAGKAAMGVWVLAGSWSSDHRTGGFIPSPILSRWGTRADARRLVIAGLWSETSRDGEDGWLFHDWATFQPAVTVNPQVSEARAEAGRRGGIASGKTRREATPKQVASGLVEPPVPVPTRPEPTTPNGVVRKGADILLPTSWEPNSDHQSRALRGGLDLDIEATKFRAHADEHERTAKNWNAAFTRWLINATEYAIRDRTRPGASAPRSRVDQNLDVVRQIAMRDGLLPHPPQIGEAS